MAQDPDREARIAEMMEQGLDRPEAEMAVALERGETEGDTPSSPS